jgi:hypothetical protein
VAVFFLVLLVVAPVYMGLGYVYNTRVVGKDGGMAALPNIAFWRRFPFLVQDAFAWCWTQVKTCCGRREDPNAFPDL